MKQVLRRSFRIVKYVLSYFDVINVESFCSYDIFYQVHDVSLWSLCVTCSLVILSTTLQNFMLQDVSSFQLAWEYLDLAKVIYLK